MTFAEILEIRRHVVPTFRGLTSHWESLFSSAKDCTGGIARKYSSLFSIQQPGHSRSKLRLVLSVLLATRDFLVVLVPLLLFLSWFCYFRGESHCSIEKTKDTTKKKNLEEVWFDTKSASHIYWNEGLCSSLFFSAHAGVLSRYCFSSAKKLREN